MEHHFKSYNDVFPNSWNTRIVQRIEEEIKKLGMEAKHHLSDKRNAKQNEDKFRRCFMEMGSVLVELPLFKDFTKWTTCDVLEACLRAEWGYSYLFELGMSLQRGIGDQSEEESRVAHMLLAKFSHFKEVMTMAWNTETSQKPVEDTVKGIKGQAMFSHDALPIDREALLKSFEAFERSFKELFVRYTRPGEDLVALVAQTRLIGASLQDVSCDGGCNAATKKKLPAIMAGVFALFTIHKSGESFNKIEESEEAAGLADKLLMKPNNIQILTLLYMFGCGNLSCSSLESQLLQIRTGEGKSMILDAAAAVLGLLGYRVRSVCYSDYVSNRDYGFFEDVFTSFGLQELVKYSKITTLSENTTAAKGHIRGLTGSLLKDKIHHMSEDGFVVCKKRAPLASLARSSKRNKRSSPSIPSREIGVSTRSRSAGLEATQEVEALAAPHGEAPPLQRSPENENIGNRGNNLYQKQEILLVDEVDVFFGLDFYGQTYNQVPQLHEPEVVTILKAIWEAYKQGGRRQRLADIQRLAAYKSLVRKVRGFEYMIDNEISLMLDQVRRVGEKEHFLDGDRIGYKVMDCVSYNVTYGYRTVFAYLQEAGRGNLKEEARTLQKVLCMHISCGQFSYADIHPTRILGVSGTLEAMGTFERKVLGEYGIGNFLFMPSVYG